MNDMISVLLITGTAWCVIKLTIKIWHQIRGWFLIRRINHRLCKVGVPPNAQFVTDYRFHKDINKMRYQ